MVGHGGKVVFHQAYGSRKLAGEPGLDGAPAPAEPMTEDTIFDLASLTKCLATAVAVMQLYEQGKVAFDDPVQKYLPDFNTTNDPQRTKVTIRMLLTNTSGEGIDVSLRDPWGWPDPTRQRHPSRAHHAAAVGTRRGVPLLRHQLPAARRAAREDHRRGRGRLRAAPRVRAARHARHPVSSAGQGVRPAYHPGSRDRLGAERRADDGVPRMDLAHNTFAAHRADCT